MVNLKRTQQHLIPLSHIQQYLFRTVVSSPVLVQKEKERRTIHPIALVYVARYNRGPQKHQETRATIQRNGRTHKHTGSNRMCDFQSVRQRILFLSDTTRNGPPIYFHYGVYTRVESYQGET